AVQVEEAVEEIFALHLLRFQIPYQLVLDEAEVIADESVVVEEVAPVAADEQAVDASAVGEAQGRVEMLAEVLVAYFPAHTRVGGAQAGVGAKGLVVAVQALGLAALHPGIAAQRVGIGKARVLVAEVGADDAVVALAVRIALGQDHAPTRFRQYVHGGTAHEHVLPVERGTVALLHGQGPDVPAPDAACQLGAHVDVHGTAGGGQTDATRIEGDTVFPQPAEAEDVDVLQEEIAALRKE